MKRIFLLMQAALLMADPLTLVISNETAPAGGMAQIKVWSVWPASINQGRIIMDFDPAVFGDIDTVAVFSATGDACAAAIVQSQHLDVHFTSDSGGIGRLPDLPILAVSIPVLPGAVAGAQAAINLDPTGTPWLDARSNQYTVTVNSGVFTVDGKVSIARVEPGGGIQTASAVLKISGIGFAPDTAVEVNGVPIASVQFVSSQEIDVTLGAPAEITGKRVRLRNRDGNEVVFFPSVRRLVQLPPASGVKEPIQATFPLRAYSEAASSVRASGPFGTGFVVFHNPSPTPADVVMREELIGISPIGASFTIPGGGIDAWPALAGHSAVTLIKSSVPIQMVNVTTKVGMAPIYATGVTTVSIPPLALKTKDLLVFRTRSGAPPPETQILPLDSIYLDVNFSASADTISGGAWLSISPARGMTHINAGSLTVTVNPSMLAPGVYLGSITVTPDDPKGTATVAQVRLDVLGSGSVVVTPFASGLVAPSQLTNSFRITPPVSPGPFTLTAATDAGGPWLTANPQPGTSPSMINIEANPAGLGPGVYSGWVTASGSGNTQIVPVQLTVPGGPQLIPKTTLAFEAVARVPGLPPQVIAVNSGGKPVTASVKTNSGGNWLSASLTDGAMSLSVSANPAGLQAGVYTGTVTLTSAPALGPMQTPVVLTVLAGAPVPVVSPSRIDSLPARLLVDSGLNSVAFQVQASTEDGRPWLKTSSDQRSFIGATADVSQLLPGTYHGKVTITALGASVTVPVTLTLPPPPEPILGAIVNAASQTRGAVAPGEIVTVHGNAMGPKDPAGLTVGADGRVATQLSGVRVLFDGTPAPLIAVSGSAINAIVPYEAGSNDSTNVELEYNTVRSAAVGIPVAPTAPAIFAVLNEDYSMNDPSNPAARGSIIQLYGTGEGLTDPPGVTGSIIHGDLKRPVERVSVTIDGIDAPVLYAGSAGESVAGLFQVNVRVPQEVGNVPSVPVFLTVGEARSQEGVSLALK